MGTRDEGHKACNLVVALAVLLACLTVARVLRFVLRADTSNRAKTYTVVVSAMPVEVDVVEIVVAEIVSALCAGGHVSRSASSRFISIAPSTW